MTNSAAADILRSIDLTGGRQAHLRRTDRPPTCQVRFSRRNGKASEQVVATSFDIWGAAAPGLLWPSSALAYLLLALTLVLTLGVFLRLGGLAALRAMDRDQWLTWAGLALAALLLGQLFPLHIPWANPILRQNPATAFLLPLSAVAYLLAGAALNPPAAMLVGLVAGLSRAVWQTGAPIDVLTPALAAGLSAWLMGQNYSGRLFTALRQPLVAGTLGRLAILAGVVLQTLATIAPRAGFLGALDMALFAGGRAFLPLMIEGAVGGLVVGFVLWMVPRWRPARGLVPSPFQRSLQRQLRAAFLSFAAVVFLLSAVGAFLLSARSAGRAVTGQMIADSDALAVRLGALQSTLTTTLERSAADPALATGDRLARSTALGRLQRAAPQFSRISLVSVEGIFNDAADSDGLAPAERATLDAALTAGQPRFGFGQVDGAPAVTLAVPRLDADGRRMALVGRVAPSALAAVAEPTAPGGVLFVDESSRVVLAAGDVAAGDTWAAPGDDQRARRLTGDPTQAIYERLDGDGARQLIYTAPVAESGWKVVAVVPRAQILRQALGVMGPLSLLLLVVSGLFFAYVAALGRDITQPLAEMNQASRAIAGGGGLERPVRSQREDEIGQLSLAFSQMQRALRQRLDELSLLLSVSNDLAATMNLGEGMTAVLQGILRGTGAAGARAVVRNPNGPAPLVFAEGPAADSLAALDRAIVRHMREADELALTTSAEIESALGTAAPVAALFALPLRLAGDYQGALYLGYRQPHYFDSDERGLLRTLAGQASVLVHNAYLFAAAEGGRRRLAAILASTTNAVIVTDQTDRVLLLNPAMEHAFALSAADVTNRPVAGALAADEAGRELARRLTLGGPASAPEGRLELEIHGRSFLGGLSTVYNSERQAIGRVAVLQDVTELMEVDRLKTEFIDGISHDLRSPLTYMRTFAAMLPVADDPSLEREYVDKINTGIERLSRLVNDLLEMTRIRAGIDLQLDHVDVAELLAEIAQEYASPAHIRGLQLVIEAAPNLPPIKADPALLRRAVTNLVANTLNHAPHSGPVILRAEQVGSEMVLSVTDHGPGIPAEDAPRLFEKFYRGRQASAERGSGLGLAIVKSVADLHGGRVWCDTTPGRGCTFSLALPTE